MLKMIYFTVKTKQILYSIFFILPFANIINLMFVDDFEEWNADDNSALIDRFHPVTGIVSKWGNPFIAKEYGREKCLATFCRYIY